MPIVGGLDLHRRQITFDWVDTDTGETGRGQIRPADREHVREWLAHFADRPVMLAVEGCTGWRFIVEECQQAGIEIHVAEPAQAAALRGPKRQAKTDRLDARHLRTLLAAGQIPESWIPPEQVREVRAMVRLYKDLLDERTGWLQRIRATLFHQGAPALPGSLLTQANRQWLEQGEGLSTAGRQAVAVALRVIDALDAELDVLRAQLTAFGRRQPGCRALTAEYGIGALIATAVWAELGDTRRFTASRQAVRHTGLDITVHASDTNRAGGHLARQGSPVLRWALVEAARCASRPAAPDHAYYQQVKDRRDSGRAALSVARKLVRRAHHTLRELGEEAFAPV